MDTVPSCDKDVITAPHHPHHHPQLLVPGYEHHHPAMQQQPGYDIKSLYGYMDEQKKLLGRTSRTPATLPGSRVEAPVPQALPPTRAADLRTQLCGSDLPSLIS